jgi:CheY-like chemotaxis protein
MSNKRKILIVDDEADIELLIRNKFRREIRDNQYEFVFAKNGVETLAQTLLDTYGNMEGRVKLHFPMSDLELDVELD